MELKGTRANSRISKSFTFAFGNPTVWGKTAHRAVSGSQASVWAMAEAQLLKDQLKGLERKGIAGRDIYGSPAVPLHRGVTEAGQQKSSHGGVLLMPQKALACTTMGGVKGSEGFAPANGIGNQWLAIDVGANKTIMLMVAYLEASIGATGANLVRLYAMAAYIQARRKLTLCAADWNLTPEELAGTDFLEMTGMSVLVPVDLEATCTSGSGRVLDYFVVSTPAPDPGQSTWY